MMPDIDALQASFFEEIQKIMARHIRVQHFRGEDIGSICGVDISYRGENGAVAAVTLSLQDKEIIEKAVCYGRPSFPYMPGLLFLREGPLMLSALKKLKNRPSLILVDGHGIAHPRRAGIAVFIGLITDIPTIGVAKSILIGRLGKAMGGLAPIFINSSKVGYTIYPNHGRRYYMSPGNKVRVEDIVRVVELTGLDYPQPLREAHKISKKEVETYEWN